MAGVPSASTPAKAWRAAAARTASTATLTLPSVPFLKPDRHRQSGAQLAVDLALGGASADRAPGHGVGDVLRGDRVEPLDAHGQPERHHLQQQPARDAQAAVHVPGAVQVGVVDQALPPGGGARLLEVDAHDHAQVVAQLAGLRGQAVRVLQRRLGVVHAAGPHDHQQPVVVGVQHRLDLLAPAHDLVRQLVGERQLVEDALRRDERDDPLDALVADVVEVDRPHAAAIIPPSRLT